MLLLWRMGALSSISTRVVRLVQACWNKSMLFEYVNKEESKEKDRIFIILNLGAQLI